MPAAPATWASAPAQTTSASWLDTVAVLAAGLVLFGLGLGGYPLWDPGEGRNAQAAREMAAAGTWLVPRLWGEPYYDKPAPFFGLLRIFQAALGPSEWALRLPSMLASLATLLLLHRFARPRFGRGAAALACVIYATSPEVVALARFCNFDATLTLATTAATLAWLSWLDGRRGFPLAAYVAMGLGVLVKGPVAIVLPVLVAALCAQHRHVLARTLRDARPVLGGLVMAAIVLPWLLPAAIADPGYVHTFFVRHNVERYLSSSFQHVRGPLYFLPVLVGGLLPWSLLVPVAALSGARNERAPDLLIWAGVVIVFFSLGQAKLATYVLPAFPAIALWLAIGLGDLDRIPARAGSLLRGVLRLWTVALVLLPAGLLLWVRASYPDLVAGVTWALPLPLLAWIGARRVRADGFRTRTVCLVFAALNAVALTTFYVRGAPIVSAVASDAAIAAALRRVAPGATVLGFRIQPASLAYYSDVPVRRVRRLDELRAAARRGPLLIVTRRRHERALREAGIPLYEWLDTRRHLLYATVPVP